MKALNKSNHITTIILCKFKSHSSSIDKLLGSG